MLSIRPSRVENAFVPEEFWEHTTCRFLSLVIPPGYFGPSEGSDSPRMNEITSNPAVSVHPLLWVTIRPSSSSGCTFELTSGEHAQATWSTDEAEKQDRYISGIETGHWQGT